MTEIVQDQKVKVSLTINGKSVEKYVEPRKLLSDFIREDLTLQGTHVGCEHGVCGSCTILFNGTTVRSCLMLAVQANNSEIKTVESLYENEKLSSLQQSFIESHGLQCGFCTPGVLMSAYEMLENYTKPSREEIKEVLSGHLCRCTGYEGIIEAIENEFDRKNKEGIQ